jgi:FMN phosphatase YigB (HAD superfamily)
MSTTKNVIFDLGGVLLNLDIERTLEAYRQMGLHNIEEMFRLGHATSFFKQYETGAISDAAFIESIEKLPENTGTQQQIVEAWNAMLLDFPAERVEWLRVLKTRYRLFLFSNTNSIHLNSFQQSFYDSHGFMMDELFEKAYYSHRERLRKPEPAAYELVLNANSLLPGETVFIDDALVNVEAANALGINGIHLEPGISVTSLEFR